MRAKKVIDLTKISILCYFYGKYFDGKVKFCIFAVKIIEDMAITILSAKRFATTLKATIHRTGRLGFTSETATALDLNAEKFAKFLHSVTFGCYHLIHRMLSAVTEDFTLSLFGLFEGSFMQKSRYNSCSSPFRMMKFGCQEHVLGR